MARKVTRYTDKLIAIVKKEIKDGETLNATADKYGIPRTTVHTWMFPTCKNKKSTVEVEPNIKVLIDKIHDMRVSTSVRLTELDSRLVSINNKIDELHKLWKN